MADGFKNGSCIGPEHDDMQYSLEKVIKPDVLKPDKGPVCGGPCGKKFGPRDRAYELVGPEIKVLRNIMPDAPPVLKEDPHHHAYLDNRVLICEKCYARAYEVENRIRVYDTVLKGDPTDGCKVLEITEISTGRITTSLSDICV